MSNIHSYELSYLSTLKWEKNKLAALRARLMFLIGRPDMITLSYST